ncbi:MAG: hypothetical protein AAGF97_07815 [Planctomycetota bacterium]
MMMTDKRGFVTGARQVAWACLLALVGGSSVGGVELVDDGGFEYATQVPGWVLQESIFDQATMQPRDFGDINSAQQQGFSPQSGDLALWLRAFAGLQSASPDSLANATLSQTVPAVPGEHYTFSGFSRWELLYSGGVSTLSPSGPLGPVASPTETTMELAFLDMSGATIGSPQVLDLRTEQNNFDAWVQHTLEATAPATATGVRVTASARAMLWNGGGTESAFFDNFSLTASADSNAQLLENSDLEDEPGFFDPAWVVEEVAGGRLPNDPTVSTADFANRGDSGGQLGLWLRSFTGDSDEPADAIVSQTLDAVAGGEYTFSAWSNFQTNYTGGLPGFGTQTLMQMAFLDGTGLELGTPLVLDLAAEQTNGSGWVQHLLTGTAPAGTASVRVAALGLNMEHNPMGGQQSAFLDDLSLLGPSDVVSCDFNGDMTCGGDDVDALVANIVAGTNVPMFDLDGNGVVDQADLDEWRALAGATNLPSGNPYLVGDANLDGNVDGQDFIAWNTNKFTSLAAWTGGDFNADGLVDGQDFVAWNVNKFTSADRLLGVPEPSMPGWLYVALLLVGRRGVLAWDKPVGRTWAAPPTGLRAAGAGKQV